MTQQEYQILLPADPPDCVYLLEALHWPAFGRFPPRWYNIEDEVDLRFSSQFTEYDAPIPLSEYLTDEECNLAELPPDPRVKWGIKLDVSAAEWDGYIKSLDRDIYKLRNSSVENTDEFKKILAHRENTVLAKSESEEWLETYLEYVDQFQNKLCLALRKGEITASGLELPENLSRLDPIEFEALDYEEIEDFFGCFDEVEVPKNNWISKNINWTASSIQSRYSHLIRVNIKFADLLKIFPMSDLYASTKAKEIGTSYILPSSTVKGSSPLASKRGRPSLPWENFHVEVARLFKDGAMPTKKEAAIAHFQDWFSKEAGKSPSRSAIGSRLKPYYDQLIKKDKK